MLAASSLVLVTIVGLLAPTSDGDTLQVAAADAPVTANAASSPMTLSTLVETTSTLLETTTTTAAPTTTVAETTTTVPETTTTAPPTTAAPTTTAPPPSTTQPPKASSSYSDPDTMQVWLDLAQCESGGDWSIDTGNGYYGGLQFSLATWESVGGTGYPHEHPRDTQIEMGRRLQARQGWDAWPHCSEELGLT